MIPTIAIHILKMQEMSQSHSKRATGSSVVILRTRTGEAAKMEQVGH